MAKIIGTPTVQLFVQLQICEAEAKALDAMVGYGFDSFLNAFRKDLGCAYMNGNEDGLRLFFESVRSTIPGLLAKAKQARDAFDE